MKRIVFLVFICIAVTLMVLPPTHPNAAQKRGLAKNGPLSEDPELLQMREHWAKLNHNKHPHDGITTSINMADHIEDISRATIKVASLLPPIKASTGGKIERNLVDDNSNIIDQEIFATLANRNVEPAAPATDEEFCRRIYFDLTGRQPTVDQLNTYVASTDADKQNKLIDSLIASTGFTDTWTQWFGDLTNNYALSPFSPYERNAQYTYLHNAVINNTPVNEIATGLITYSGKWTKGPGAFQLRPIFGQENYQDAYDDLAAQASKVFLGTQAVCVSCHNGVGHLEPVNLYFSTKSRSDFWGFAAFFAQTTFKPMRRNIVIKSNPAGKYDANTDDGSRPPRTGGIIPPSYNLFGEAKPDFSKDGRNQVAELITNDIQFSRAFVNRVFARFFTLGLVEPLDGFDLARLDPQNPPPSPWQLQASHPVLLNSLAAWFQQNNYNLKALVKLMVSSRAYGLSSRYDESNWKSEYTHLYARKLVRRLQAEEVLDAVLNATKVPGSYYVLGFDKPFNTVMSLPGVGEPFGNSSKRQSDDAGLVVDFLKEFGQGNRFDSPRTNFFTITQALNLFNSDLVIGRLGSKNSLATQLADAVNSKKITPEDAVKALYLETLSRNPSSAEIERLKEQTTFGKDKISDLQWVLLNRFDFLYNY